MSTTIICWDNLLSGSVGAIIGVVGAFTCAYYAAYRSKKLNEQAENKKTLDDLYYVITQLSGFINYLQFACRMNSAFSIQDYQNILNRIRNVDKGILDISQSFFYNSKFKDKVKIELCKFIESYIGWKGYKALLPTEGLVEYNYINDLQINAIDCLNEVVAQNSDNITLVDYVNKVAAARGNIKTSCQETIVSLKFIVSNLTFIFNDSLFCALLKRKIDNINIQYVQEKVVCQCFKYIITNNFFAINNSEYGKVLFYQDIKSERMTPNDGTYLVDSDGKQYDINNMVDYIVGLYKDK